MKLLVNRWLWNGKPYQRRCLDWCLMWVLQFTVQRLALTSHPGPYLFKGLLSLLLRSSVLDTTITALGMHNYYFAFFLLFCSFKIPLSPQVLEKMLQYLREVQKCSPVQWMETQDLTLHGTWAVKLVEYQFYLVGKSWKQEKVGATLAP